MSNIHISDSEWIIMNLLWETPNIGLKDIVAMLENQVDWKYKTFYTLIRRLTDKNIISYRNDGTARIYYPLVNKDACIIQESESFINKAFNGSAKEMMLCFVEKNILTEKDIAELKEILEKNS